MGSTETPGNIFIVVDALLIQLTKMSLPKQQNIMLQTEFICEKYIYINEAASSTLKNPGLLQIVLEMCATSLSLCSFL